MRHGDALAGRPVEEIEGANPNGRPEGLRQPVDNSGQPPLGDEKPANVAFAVAAKAKYLLTLAIENNHCGHRANST